MEIYLLYSDEKTTITMTLKYFIYNSSCKRVHVFSPDMDHGTKGIRYLLRHIPRQLILQEWSVCGGAGDAPTWSWGDVVLWLWWNGWERVYRWEKLLPSGNIIQFMVRRFKTNTFSTGVEPWLLLGADMLWSIISSFDIQVHNITLQNITIHKI